MRRRSPSATTPRDRSQGGGFHLLSGDAGLTPPYPWRVMRRSLPFLLLLPGLAACTDPTLPAPPTSSSSGSGGGGGSATPAVACDAHAVTGPAGYVDRSEAWGLTAQKVTGILLSAADLDGDGYPDLIAHT